MQIKKKVSSKFAFISIVLFATLFLSELGNAQEWLIGVDADMTSVAAAGGRSIYEGAQIAVSEVNEAGGVAGRSLKLVVRNHRGNPARGKDNIDYFASLDNLVAVLGGVHTPVVLHQLPSIHESRIPFLVPWAAGTTIIDNGYEPNYVYRASVRDAYAGPFLMAEAQKKGAQRIVLFLERTGWGRSNLKSMEAAAQQYGIEVVKIIWFSWGEKDFNVQIDQSIEAGAQLALLVANAPEGAAFIRHLAMEERYRKLPVLSHWGLTGGNFAEEVGSEILNKVQLSVLQTFSFLNAQNKTLSNRVFQKLQAQFRSGISVEEVRAPVGIAHAYDLVHLLAQAMRQAAEKHNGDINREFVRDALENLEPYEGLMKNYAPAFSPQDHEALGPEDLQLGVYNDKGFIVPAGF